MLAYRNTRSPAIYLVLAIATIGFLFLFQPSLPSPSGWYPSHKSSIVPANATLGFGGLFVVSGPGSPRRKHIEEAAAVTELDLRIPQQVLWSDDDVRNFRPEHEEESRVLTGSVKAWLSHHLVLHEFLNSGVETALIFEDDVDWDIRLRTRQIPLAQQAMQKFSQAEKLDAEKYPWGTPNDWDLLYVGHCGDYFGDVQEGVGVGHHHPEDLRGADHLFYEDKTLEYRTDLHPFTASLFTAFQIPEQTRMIHRSQFPLCTFGYAITRRAAELILNEVAPSHEDLSLQVIAYDAAILHGCHHVLRCYSVNPELFHHMEGESLIANLEASERVIFRPPVDEAGLEQVKYRLETSNIGCGFFSGDFYFDGNMDKLAYLREEVGRKGRCLKNGRDPLSTEI